MKISITSDIHLEFGDWYPSNPESADTLILGGDILVANDLSSYKAERYLTFLDNCKKEYKNVIYIMGNHEYYNGNFATTSVILRKETEKRNIHFLDKECITIDDVVFIGGTLWTDMNGEDSMTLHAIKDMMNDFRCITNTNKIVYKDVPIYEYDENGKVKLDQNGYGIKIGMKKKETYGLFSPEDAVEEHRKFLKYIEHVLSNKSSDKKYVVCSHHAPSNKSIHPRYASDSLMNGGYRSNLDFFIEDRPEIKLWTHGHVHSSFDYMIGQTRVICNPRGYVGHERRFYDKDEPYLAKVVEV